MKDEDKFTELINDLYLHNMHCILHGCTESQITKEELTSLQYTLEVFKMILDERRDKNDKTRQNKEQTC